MRYTPITIDELRPLFQKTDSQGRGWKEAVVGNGEVVFDFPFSPDCTIRVYTSIRASTEVVANVGNDAIRCCAFNPLTDQGLVKAPRVYRVEGWRDNLKERVRYVFKEIVRRKRVLTAFVGFANSRKK